MNPADPSRSNIFCSLSKCFWSCFSQKVQYKRKNIFTETFSYTFCKNLIQWLRREADPNCFSIMKKVIPPLALFQTNGKVQKKVCILLSVQSSN